VLVFSPLGASLARQGCFPQRPAKGILSNSVDSDLADVQDGTVL
jgi:hypothetical protein